MIHLISVTPRIPPVSINKELWRIIKDMGKFIDLTGQRFGERIVIRKIEKPENIHCDKIYWECICEEGHITIAGTGNLRKGIANNCPECHAGLYKGIDETGNVYGSWRVIEFSFIKKYKIGAEAYWKCECVSCGRIFDVSGRNLRTNRSKACASCSQRIMEEGESSFNDLYRGYKNGAIKRNLKFEISKDFVKKITKLNCHYCGIEPHGIKCLPECNGIYVYNGIDRINNNVGYTEENCVPCCKNCNLAKQTMSKEQFLFWVNKIYVYRHGLKYSSPNSQLFANVNPRYINHFYLKYKKNAKEKNNREFNLSLEFFSKLIQDSCFYCGEKNSDQHKYNKNVFYCNGIDRLDSEIGYTEGNCVSCCKKCNYVKLKMSEQEFYEWIDMVYLYNYANYNI